MKNLLSALILFCLSCTWVQAQEFALKQLEASPRHQEWVQIPVNGRQVRCFVVYPEKAKNSTVVIVIHENRGLTDWVRSFADQLAADGYVAIAPDLLSDFNDKVKKTTDFESADAARDALYQLPPAQVTSDLNAVQAYASGIRAGNGKTAVVGFCWGGGQSFGFATKNTQLKAALVFYGTAPSEAEAFRSIQAPVYGFYAENDQRINAGIAAAESQMEKAGKQYDYKIYPGAGHAYMRQGEDPAGSAENRQARNQSWERIRQILAGL